MALAFINLENPSNEFEKELVDSLTHAEAHLMAGYIQSVKCGLMDTQAKSQGMMVALCRVLGHHLVQHHINMLCPIEDVQKHMESIVNNLNLYIDENYQGCLEVAMLEAAAQEQKH